MKIYTVFLFDIDEPNKHAYLVGSFDSVENYTKVLNRIAAETQTSMQEGVDYEVFTSILNKDLLFL